MPPKQKLEYAVYNKELIKRIADNIDYHNYEVEDMLNGLRQALLEFLNEGKEVRIEHLFTVAPKVIPPRKFWHPKTGEYEMSKGSVGLSITPAKSLKDSLKALAEKV